MAQKFSGKYSPHDSKLPKREAFQGAKRSKVGGRVNLLFIVPLPLIWQSFGNGPQALALNLFALGCLLLAAWMTREGLFAQEAYEARKIARHPAMPRKLFGSVLTGLGLAIAGYAANSDFIAPSIYAIVGCSLHIMAFGIDPMRNKGIEGVDLFQTDRVARAVSEAEEHLHAMSNAVKRAGDRTLESRVTQFQQTARALFRTVENDPRDLTAARRYLGVYLLGAKDATVKFADIYARTHDTNARSNYEALLDDLEENFAARNQKLLLDDNSDLNIEIDVLRERLQREGVR